MVGFRSSNGRGSLVRGAENGVEPLAATPALAVAVVWAAFAVLLPLVVRGRWLGFDLVGAGLWALGLVAAQVALGDVLAPEVATEQARGLVAGTLVAALVAVSVARMRPRPEAWHAPRGQLHRTTLRGEMSMLRNLEAKLGGLVEGAFGRAFKSSVQPVELAHKLAKEMEENQRASVSRVYVPNHYRVFLSPRTASSSRVMSPRCGRSYRTTCSSMRARSASR